METAKVFENGRSQAIRLPKKFRFTGDEVVVQRLGHAVILVPKEEAWQTFMDGINGFTEDILKMADPKMCLQLENRYDVYA